MTLSIPCRQFNGISKPDTSKRDEVYIDPVSVELCQVCTEPDCDGAKAADRGGYSGPPRCAYEAAVMGRRNVTARVVTLPGPRPDGAMRQWACELARLAIPGKVW